jgi:Protein of unknown function (DUF4012)
VLHLWMGDAGTRRRACYRGPEPPEGVMQVGPPEMDQPNDLEPVAEPVARSRRRSPSVVWLVGAGGAIAVVAILALSGASALGVRRHLVDGRDALSAGRSSLVAGDAAGARDEFARAEEAFRAADDEARSPWLTVTGLIPLLGRTPHTIRAVAEASVQTGEAATGLASAIADLPGGLAALSPTAHGIPTDRLPGLAEAVARSAALTGQAIRTLDATPSGLVLPQVASARDAARAQLEDVHGQLEAGSLILQGLPAFLGADGPRHYFIGASNPAELRGSGGLIGAYAILTIDQGRLSLSDFRPIQSIRHPALEQVPSPSAEYSSNFDFFRHAADGFWLNINMSPDFPLDAKAIWLAYRQSTGQALDGIIVADPFALKALMHVTGPVDVGKTGLTVTESDIVPFVTNQAYALFGNNEERKRVLGRVAGSVLESFLGGSSAAVDRLRAALAAFSDGHLKVWSNDPSMERGLADTTAGGSYRPSGTDSLSVVTNSSSGTKLDYYQARSITYDVQLGPAGMATASASVEIGNPSPTSGLPAYVIGPFKHFSREPGENVALVHLYCDKGCVLQRATDGAKPIQLRRLEQAGFPFFEDYVRTSSGDTSTIEAHLFLPEAWTGNDTGGTYRLSFIGQTTIRPITLQMIIHAPDGMAFTSASDQLIREGDDLVYEGHPRGNLDLEASFAPSLPVRVWRTVVHALP